MSKLFLDLVSKLKTNFQIQDTKENPEDWPESWKRKEYKIYPRFPQIPLNPGQKDIVFSFKKLLSSRTSKLSPNTSELTFEKLSDIIYFSFGQIKETEKRFYPSAGGRYSQEIYIIVRSDILGLNSGVYHFNILENCLERMWDFNIKDRIYYDNSLTDNAKVMIVVSSIFDRSVRKYGDLALKFIYIETGAILQNMQLLATGHNISSCIKSHNDVALEEMLEIDNTTELITGLITFNF
jgi:SagB-type dehydrogenase family enzyme